MLLSIINQFSNDATNQFFRSIFSLGNWGERLATGWVVLNETDDVFLAAATFAVRQAPQLIFAPIGGAVADRFSRGKIMLAIGIYKALILKSMDCQKKLILSGWMNLLLTNNQ